MTAGWPWGVALAVLLLIYFYAHYGFASITAHVTAMFTPFLLVVVAAGAPPLMAVLFLAYFSNLSASLTHYGTTTAPHLFRRRLRHAAGLVAAGPAGVVRDHRDMDRNRSRVVETARLVVGCGSMLNAKVVSCVLYDMKRLLLAVAAVVMALGVPVLVHAQVGSTTDIITGKVTGPNGEPIAGARVEVMSLETQVTRFRTTNEKGQYTLLYPDGGGAYRVTFKAIGMAPFVLNLNRQADEDRLEADAKMSPTSQRLGQIVVRAAPNPNGNERPTAGSTEKVLTGEQLYRLPVDASDPALVASLAPGVILLGGSDSTANSFVIAGQRADQNQITLDGLSFGSGSVPSEAVRNTRVITNTYDVARGQFTGGQVASTTRSGTNVIQGSAGYVMNQPDLEFPDTSSQATARYTSESAQLRRRRPVRAGPVVLVRLRERKRAVSSDINTLLNANDLLLERSNAAPDSVTHFLSTLSHYGIPTSSLIVPEQRPHEPVYRADANGLRPRRPAYADHARRLELDCARRHAPEHALGTAAWRRHQVARRRAHGVTQLAIRHRHHQRGAALLRPTRRAMRSRS